MISLLMMSVSFADQAEPEARARYRARHRGDTPGAAATIGDARGPSDDEQRVATEYLSARGLLDLFPYSTWQRDLVAKCRSRLAIQPKRAEAILFYSQLPDGTPPRFFSPFFPFHHLYFLCFRFFATSFPPRPLQGHRI